MKSIFLLSLLFLASPASAAESCHVLEQGFAPRDDLEAIDVRLIDGARERIDFAAYVLTSTPVIDALTRAAQRGVVVRVYRDGRDARQPRKLAEAIDRLAAELRVEIRYKGSPAPFMHLKSYTVDGRLLRTGAGNFTHGGLKRQDNDLVVVDCASAISTFQAAFEAMWRR
ncbi:phospholipase D-like domain-containing protein [Methylosinus sp. Sm6]|uniref:phospholipase D-like domain-containing protein n=1 Tax=Methylosinus sp. Sm6 TaxID=2866948 RepID=UPI001C9981F2|nr:phospholipase D-like domain-containing protein [Methylosinus sp. Sm6]MBY6244083.1 phosphatidylserine synthase [Methylosinus sp. Sm6]